MKSNPLVAALEAKNKPSATIELPPLRTLELQKAEIPADLQPGASVSLKISGRLKGTTLEIFTVEPEGSGSPDETQYVKTQDSVSPGAA